MKKSLVLAMAMALGVTASAYAANPFSDVPAGHWAYDSISKLAAAGVIEGYGDTTFGGDKLMTRYEMAQIVAKAMAKGANVDKLAAEFADELDNLGVRVANLEKKADNVKITGQIRAMYQSYDENRFSKKAPKDDQTSTLRTRLWITGQVNEDWSYTGMIQNEQNLLNDNGDEETRFQRAFVNGKIGGLKVKAGRDNTVLAGGNVLSNRTDSVAATFGKDVKLTAQYGKLASGTGLVKAGTAGPEYDTSNKGKEYYAITLAGKVANVDVEANYVDIKEDASVDKVDNNIWTIGAKAAIAKDLTLNAMYLKADVENKDGDDDGYVIGLAYKGAKAAKAGSWGLYANYYDQSVGTYLHHGMNTDLANDMNNTVDGGYKGYMVGLKYAVAKNMVAAVEYSDFEAKVSDNENKTIWSELIFTF